MVLGLRVKGCRGGRGGITSSYIHIYIYILTPPHDPPKRSFLGEKGISVSFMYIYAVSSLSHRILESWIHGSPSDHKFQLNFIRFDRIGEFWIEHVHVGILESWIAGFRCGPGSESHLLNSISI